MTRQRCYDTVMTEIDEVRDALQVLSQGYDEKAARVVDNYRDATGLLVLGDGQALAELLEPPLSCQQCGETFWVLDDPEADDLTCGKCMRIRDAERRAREAAADFENAYLSRLNHNGTRQAFEAARARRE